MENKFSKAQQEAKAYVEHHNLEKIIGDMLNALVYSKDPSPPVFMIKYLANLVSTDELASKEIFIGSSPIHAHVLIPTAEAFEAKSEEDLQPSPKPGSIDPVSVPKVELEKPPVVAQVPQVKIEPESVVQEKSEEIEIPPFKVEEKIAEVPAERTETIESVKETPVEVPDALEEAKEEVKVEVSVPSEVKTVSDSQSEAVVNNPPAQIVTETVDSNPPVVSEPVVSEPVVIEPVVSAPVVPEPVVTEPVVTEPVVEKEQIVEEKKVEEAPVSSENPPPA